MIAARWAMAIFDVLARQQREIQELIGDVRNAITTHQRALAAVTFQLVAMELGACLRAERAVVYPRLAEIAGLASEIEQARREHAAIECSLDRLRIAGLHADAWDAELDRLARLVTAHADLEEYSLFPIASLALSARELNRLDRAYAALFPRTVEVAGAAITYEPPAPEPQLPIVRFKAA